MERIAKAGAELIEEPMQLRPIPASTRSDFLKDAPAAGRREGLGLRDVVLIVSLGDTRIA
jgi:hypothetical protein